MEQTNRSITPERRQRLVAVYRANGGNVAAAARDVGVTIRTAHRWVKRFRADGECGLQPRSHARKTAPKNRLDRAIVAKVRWVHRKYPAFTNQRIADLLTAEGVPISKSSVHRLLRQQAPATPNMPRIIFPKMLVAATRERHLQNASLLLDQAKWWEADALALALSKQETAGSERWAMIVLTYCPLARQQAGDAARAEEIIAHVERTCREAGGDPQSLSPPIRALIDNRRGWIHDGLFGQFKTAAQLFISAAPYAAQAGDKQLLDQCTHFKVRAFVEHAMTQADAWVAAQPTRTLPAETVALLNRNVTAGDWREVLGDGNPYHYWVQFNLLALIHPGQAAKLLDDPGSPLTAAPAVHLLSRARWWVSEQKWDRALSMAHDATVRYCALRHPLGIAHAAAIAAHARYRNGLTTHQDFDACLDAWITALRLHPFPTHPIYRAGWVGLRRALREGAQRSEHWMREYAADLPDRMAERDGAFRALDCTDAALGPLPSLVAVARSQ